MLASASVPYHPYLLLTLPCPSLLSSPPGWLQAKTQVYLLHYRNQFTPSLRCTTMVQEKQREVTEAEGILTLDMAFGIL